MSSSLLHAAPILDHDVRLRNVSVSNSEQSKRVLTRILQSSVDTKEFQPNQASRLPHYVCGSNTNNNLLDLPTTTLHRASAILTSLLEITNDIDMEPFSRFQYQLTCRHPALQAFTTVLRSSVMSNFGSEDNNCQVEPKADPEQVHYYKKSLRPGIKDAPVSVPTILFGKFVIGTKPHFGKTVGFSIVPFIDQVLGEDQFNIKTVRQDHVNGNWNIPTLLSNMFIAMGISFNSVFTNTGKEDFCIWKPDLKGSFTVKSALNEIRFDRYRLTCIGSSLLKVKNMAGSEMGGFTRVLHSGNPDNLMDEISTFVADPLPGDVGVQVFACELKFFLLMNARRHISDIAPAYLKLLCSTLLLTSKSLKLWVFKLYTRVLLRSRPAAELLLRSLPAAEFLLLLMNPQYVVMTLVITGGSVSKPIGNERGGTQWRMYMEPRFTTAYISESVAIVETLNFTVTLGIQNVWVTSDSQSAVYAFNHDQVSWQITPLWLQVKDKFARRRIITVWREVNFGADQAARRGCCIDGDTVERHMRRPFFVKNLC
ncbi:hypothetical protein GIB67_018151 [Kingdonia uniflora]|uniref:RNase H type-1 domain-containing protein n=1 Tax=Kingdonia uniflora TaxID=39325 RepID=A0A7J7NM54_9MAGN|nr:hypothetical protein GIB67_018151 [Kingdonia uniflora]